MTKYTIDLDDLSIRLFGGDGKDITPDMKSTVMNLVTAVACNDLMIVQCRETDSDVPVFLLCAFLDSTKYASLNGTGDRLIPLCELTHPADLLECVRPPVSVPRSAFVVPKADTRVLRALQKSTYSPIVEDEQDSMQQAHYEDHSKHTKH